MAEPDFLQALAGEAEKFFSFVGEALRPDEVEGQPPRPSIFEDALRRDLGLKPGVAPAGFALPQDRLDAVKTYRAASNPGAEAGAQALADIAILIDAVASIVETWIHDGGVDVEAGSQQLGHSLLDLFASNYARLRFPRLFLLLQFISLVEDVTSTYGDGSNNAVRVVDALGTLFGFLIQPGKSLKQFDPDATGGPDYLALGTDFAVRAAAIAVGWMDRDNRTGSHDIAVITDLATGWDGPGLDVDSPITPSHADFVAQRMTSIAFGGLAEEAPGDDAAAAGQLVLSTAMVPENEGGTALFLAVGGTADIEQPLGRRWTFSAKVRSDAGAAAILGSQFRVAGPASSAFQASAAFTSHPPEPSPDDPAPPQVSFSFPSSSGSRLDVGQAALALSLASSGAEMLLTLADAAVVIDSQDKDGLVAELLGKTPLTLPFNLVIGFSSARGMVIEGNVSRPGTPAQANAPLGAPGGGSPVIAATIPVGRAFGPVTVHEVALRITRGPPGAAPKDQKQLKIEVDTSFSATIGPVYVRLDQLGLQVIADSGVPPEARNLGIVDLDLGAKFPRGVAINVETALIAGGGSILHDPDQGLYFGTLDLAIRGGTTVKAMGIIATRNPDGSKGFSLMLILTVELAQPWPLGMGFFLQGIGGMLAVHRSFDEAAMRAALPTGQLRNVLFPADPVHHTTEVLHAIQTLFPVRRGSHMFGVLAKIGWAQPTLVQMELAVIYEWGNQHRLIILGRVSAILPRTDQAILKLNMDAVGILDFDAGTFALDAVLYDSRLCGKFVITGAMAMRMGWAGSGGFALSVGGLHPKFNPPAGFPSVARLQLALTNGDNPSLICRAYFAITSNTVQFGADCALYAAACGFSIEGNVGFDVLIQLLPFHFLAEFRASVQLKRGSHNLFKVSVKGALEGPLPLRVAGKATFEILWCDFSVSFDKTLVDGGTPNDLLLVDVLSVLVDALAEPRAWQAQLPAGSSALVSLRQSATEGVLMHPLGSLTVRQTVVPLGLTRDIDRVGTGTPAGDRRFAIAGAAIGGAAISATPVNELFAPAQFFDMSDEDKLAAPSFEAMGAGIALGEAGYSFDFGARAASPFDYTDITVGPDGVPVLEPEPHRPEASRVLVMTLASAAGTSRARRTLERRFEAPVLAAAPRVRRAGWAAVEEGTAPPADATLTWAEARAQVADRAHWVLVPRSELVS